MAKIEIYSTPTCTFCHLAKQFFQANGVEYTEYDVLSDLDKRKEMVDKTGQMGVPVITIDNESIVGFDEAKIRQILAL